jgi:UPF0755 protein
MKKIIITLILGLIIVIIGSLWWISGSLPVNPLDKSPKIFIIKKGEGVREIANNLKTQGLIRDPIVFFLLTKEKGLDKLIQAGDFRLNSSMTAGQVAESLTHGTLDIWITIPEGLRAEEIALLLQKQMPEYKNYWNATLNQNEGYLFPDTYLLPRDAKVDQIVTILKNNFQIKYDSVSSIKTTNLTQAQTIIVASIIEREAVFDSDRPLVASVIMNRLNLGMALGVDPTIQYAVGYDPVSKSWWKKDLTIDDLAINSPYNTRKVAGLPPTPISNPGISAIKAALNPDESDYLYYFSDIKGHLHFAKTLQGHQENIKKYGE